MKTCPSLLTKVVEWRLAVAKDEFIEERSKGNPDKFPRNTIWCWCKDYLGFNSITQHELNLVCEHANKWFEVLHLSVRVWNTMGEIRAYTFITQRELDL